MNQSPVRILILLIHVILVLSVSMKADCFQSLETQNRSGEVIELGSGSYLKISDLLFLDFLNGISDYQIGDSWGKRPVVEADLRLKDSVFVRSVSSTAYFNTATAFYLGLFNNTHVMATNHHVLPNENGCRGTAVQFPILKKRFYCTALIGSWPEIDLALFTIGVDLNQGQDLSRFGLYFDFKSALHEDTPLLTAGFGVAGNSARRMVVNENSDCRVLSNTNEFRLLADPDEINPADYRSWSFATGCSVSHGDSGSAMVNRKTGAVVGLVWTGAIPKEPRVQSSDFLKMLQKSDSEEIWSLMTYAVPASKIYEMLRSELISGKISAEFYEVVQELLLDRN